MIKNSLIEKIAIPENINICIGNTLRLFKDSLCEGLSDETSFAILTLSFEELMKGWAIYAKWYKINDTPGQILRTLTLDFKENINDYKNNEKLKEILDKITKPFEQPEKYIEAMFYKHENKIEYSKTINDFFANIEFFVNELSGGNELSIDFQKLMNQIVDKTISSFVGELLKKKGLSADFQTGINETLKKIDINEALGILKVFSVFLKKFEEDIKELNNIRNKASYVDLDKNSGTLIQPSLNSLALHNLQDWRRLIYILLLILIVFLILMLIIPGKETIEIEKSRKYLFDMLEIKESQKVSLFN